VLLEERENERISALSSQPFLLSLSFFWIERAMQWAPKRRGLPGPLPDPYNENAALQKHSIAKKPAVVIMAAVPAIGRDVGAALAGKPQRASDTLESYRVWVIRLHGDKVTWLQGYIATRLQGCTVQGYKAAS
jgi:hypothetical protein